MSDRRVQAPISDLSIAEWLARNTGLPSSSQKRLAATIPRLADRLPSDRATTIGISGAPGSGKSTLARALVRFLGMKGSAACLLSLDDYYLGREPRERLAKDLHPLFRQRGAPGSHDLDRLITDIDHINSGRTGNLRLPVFDKSRDDRAPREQWRKLDGKPRIVILEGWCVGVPPQPDEELEHPVNDTERLLDPEGVWREEMLKHWRLMHRALGERLDLVWYIRVPDWECVIDWRWLQEQELAKKNLDSRFEVEKFLGSFERIVRHMQNSYPAWANLVLELDLNHDIHLKHRNGNTK